MKLETKIHMKIILSFLLLLIYLDISQAQNTSTIAPLKEGKNNFVVIGNAEMKYFYDKNTNQFGDINMKPIFLWSISKNIFVETEVEFETGAGTVDIGLEYANMVYNVNKWLSLRAGRFLPRFGAYRGCFAEGFLNHIATDPAGFGDGGIGAMNEEGLGAQGEFVVGRSQVNYDFYLSNGPQLFTDSANAGQFDYEAYISNNRLFAKGGRIGFLPFSNSSLEIGYSFQFKKNTGTQNGPNKNAQLQMHAVDFNFFHKISPIKSILRITGEYKYQKLDNAIYFHSDSTQYTFKNTPSAYYVMLACRPALVHNKILRNFELAARYSKFYRPKDAAWGGSNIGQFAMSLNYWLEWNCLVKLTYQKQSDFIGSFIGQVVFGF